MNAAMRTNTALPEVLRTVSVKRRAAVRILALAMCLLVAGCTGGATTATPAPSSTTADPTRADTDLIIAMYDDITQAFQRNPDDGVRAIIAAQDPEDLADVDFARCVNAILPGATTLPPTKKMHFVPNVSTTTADPEYVLTSDRVKGLHPQGRIYVTDVSINDGSKPAVHQRHQVILDGKAYQFSAC